MVGAAYFSILVITVSILSKPDVGVYAAKPFFINFCADGGEEEALGFYVLDAQHGSSSLNQLCQAVSSAPAQPGDYDLSVDLYNYIGANKVHYGHPGVLFNAKDSMNFDFVYFRPHSAGSCYQTGYVVNGVAKFTATGKCPAGPPKGRTWFNVKVLVRRPHSVSTYLDGRLVKVHKMHFPALRRGGAFTFNGYGNLVYFTNYTIKKFSAAPEPPQIKGCVAGTGWMDTSTVLVNAAHGSWPSSGFCRVLLPLALPSNTSAYEFTARLYNIERSVAHPGIMYNVKDINNYDLVYFSPHSNYRPGCYQTGFVENGASRWAGAKSSACKGGTPPLKAWFTVKVKVTGARSAQVYKDGQLVVSVVPHFGLTPRVGLNVCNGYGNKMKADSFKLKAVK